MTKRERKTVQLALEILREACRPVPPQQQQPDSMRLALRVLLPYVEPQHLSVFWTAADNPNTTERQFLQRRATHDKKT